MDSAYYVENIVATKNIRIEMSAETSRLIPGRLEFRLVYLCRD